MGEHDLSVDDRARSCGQKRMNALSCTRRFAPMVRIEVRGRNHTHQRRCTVPAAGLSWRRCEVKISQNLGSTTRLVRMAHRRRGARDGSLREGDIHDDDDDVEDAVQENEEEDGDEEEAEVQEGEGEDGMKGRGTGGSAGQAGHGDGAVAERGGRIKLRMLEVLTVAGSYEGGLYGWIQDAQRSDLHPITFGAAPTERASP